MRYLIRMNCEYSLVVEAASPEEATERAKDTPTEQWDVAWAELDVEEEEAEAPLPLPAPSMTDLMIPPEAIAAADFPDTPVQD
jgi:hypothetical protein